MADYQLNAAELSQLIAGQAVELPLAGDGVVLVLHAGVVERLAGVAEALGETTSHDLDVHKGTMGSTDSLKG